MTQSTDQGTIWLAASAFEKLTAELEDLKGPVRHEIVAKISEARDEGDLKENGGYHAAREEQGKLEGRIRQLEAVLLNADSEPATDDGTVSVGKTVTYAFVGDDPETFLMGSKENEEYVDVQVYSPQSPLGSAMIGAKKGETIEYTAPNGKKLKVEIVDAVPFTG